MQRFCSIFSQLLQLFPRMEFEQAVRDHKAEYHARGFTCWGQFVAMLFCQLGRAVPAKNFVQVENIALVESA
jgi:hypothetical protein